MSIRAVVVAVAVAVLLASCGGTEEVAVEEPEATLSAEEIVRLVLEAERSIESIQVELDAVSEEDGERTESDSLHIRVGADSYEKSDDAGWPRDEVLHYGGVDYFRDEDGMWKTADELDGFAMFSEGIPFIVDDREDADVISRVKGTSVVEEVPVLRPDGWEMALLSTTYAVDFNEFRDAEVLDEQMIDGRRVIGLSVADTVVIPGSWFDDIESQMFPPEMEFEDPDGLVDDMREEMREELANSPDSIWSKQVVWIGVDDYRVYRVDMESKLYRGEALVGTGTTTQTYSLFNEAELPGPLP